MIYYDPDDPEAGYFGEDEVIRMSHTDRIYVGNEEDDVWSEVVEADCSICGGEIPEDATLPLCTTCRRTCEAHGKLMADAERYPDPENGRTK